MAAATAGVLDRLAGLLPCLSVANLLAIQIWMYLFRPGQEAPLASADFAGAMAAVVLVALASWGAVQLAGVVPAGARPRVRALGLAAMWVLVVWAGVKPSLQGLELQVPGVRRTLAVALAVGLLLATGLWSWFRAAQALQILRRLAWVLAPFVLVTFAQSGWQAWTRAAEPVAAVEAPALLAPDRHRRRTVVILFDEFDYELAFEPGLRRDPLPAFDALRRHAFFATQAYPPMHSTAMSVPAMLTGRLVRAGTYRDDLPGDLLVTYEDGKPQPFSTQTTVFSALRREGFSSLRLSDALLPHRRLPGEADADMVVAPAPGSRQSFGDYTAGHLVSLATLLPFSRSLALDMKLTSGLGLAHPYTHVQAVADQVVDLASRGPGDLLFLHILLPHMPVVFDRGAAAFGPVASDDYRDNFLGADAVLQRVRLALQAQGRWEDTNLVIVSDHFYRNKRASYGVGDHRVPFMVKLAGAEAAGLDFDTPFNTVLVHDLLLALVRGQVGSPSQLGDWIRAHARFGESPLTEYRKGW